MAVLPQPHPRQKKGGVLSQQHADKRSQRDQRGLQRQLMQTREELEARAKEQKHKPSAASQIVQIVGSSITGNIVSGAFFHSEAVAKAMEDLPTLDITGKAGQVLGEGADLLGGPQLGGDTLERPIAGYAATYGANSGIEITHAPDTMGHIARSIADNSTMNLNGREIDLLDYLPGGDIIQVEAGKQLTAADYAQTISALGIGHAMRNGIELDMSAKRDDTLGEVQKMLSASDDQDQNADRGKDLGNHDSASVLDAELAASPLAATGQPPAQKRDNESINVGDESMAMDALISEHRLALNTAVANSDYTQVHSEIHVGGKTLTIDTSYEARNDDNSYERKVGQEHVNDIAQGARGAQKQAPGISMQSQVASMNRGLER